MDSPFLGVVQLFAFNYAPSGWVQCCGQTMSISQNEVLYSIIGTAFGGDGRTTFQLPDLRGAVPLQLPVWMSYYICTSGMYPQRQ